MARLVAALFRLPLRIARPVVQPPISFVLLICGVRVRRNYSLPVASLDEARAQPIIFALRRAAVSEHVSTARSYSRRLLLTAAAAAWQRPGPASHIMFVCAGASCCRPLAGSAARLSSGLQRPAWVRCTPATQPTWQLLCPWLPAVLKLPPVWGAGGKEWGKGGVGGGRSLSASFGLLPCCPYQDCLVPAKPAEHWPPSCLVRRFRLHLRSTTQLSITFA